MPSVDFICLANSYKLGGRCIAGIRVDNGTWIRPVSDKEHGVLDARDFRLQDGSQPKIFDVIRVGLSEAKPLPYQPENWRMDGSAWRLLERPASIEHAAIVAKSISRTRILFGEYEPWIPHAHFQARPARESLVLVQPEDVRWRTQDRNTTRVCLYLDDLPHDLPLTDPIYVAILKSRVTGTHVSSELGIPKDRKILFTISLGEPYEGKCYKLAAAVVIVPPDWNALF